MIFKMQGIHFGCQGTWFSLIKTAVELNCPKTPMFKTWQLIFLSGKKLSVYFSSSCFSLSGELSFVDLKRFKNLVEKGTKFSLWTMVVFEYVVTYFFTLGLLSSSSTGISTKKKKNNNNNSVLWICAITHTFSFEIDKTL